MANTTPGQETHLNPHDAHKNKPKANGKAETKAQKKAKTEKALGALVEPNKVVDGYIKRIKTAMDIGNKGAAEMVRGVVQVGKELVAAKDDKRIKHGEWLPMLHQLQLDEDRAERLMKIAKNGVLSNSANVRNLPPSLMTLYDLARVPPHRLEAKIEDGTVHPLMERKDVKPLLPAQKPKKQKPVDDDPEEETTAGSRSPEDQWEQAIANAASEIISLDAFYTRTFGDEWKDYRASSDVVTLVKQATAAWNKLAAHIEKD